MAEQQELSSGAGTVWRLDDTSRESGRRGLVKARAALAEARRRHLQVEAEGDRHRTAA